MAASAFIKIKNFCAYARTSFFQKHLRIIIMIPSITQAMKFVRLHKIILQVFLPGFIYLSTVTDLTSQVLTAVSIDGEVYVKFTKNGKETYNRMVFGPVVNAEKIIVKNNSKVKLVNEKNMICSLDKPGDYKTIELGFTSPVNTTMFSNFLKQFKSFFGQHDNPESKSNYKNTIFAISRGQEGNLSPDFPLSGILPYGRLGSVPFIWTNDCLECSYVVRVYDLETQREVFSATTTKHSLDLENSDNKLKPGKRYYWTVEAEGIGQPSRKVYFEMSKNADFEEKISKFKNEADFEGNDLSETAKNIYILSQLEEADLINYAVLYGFYLKERNPADEMLHNVVDRMWYDHLLQP